MLNLALWLKKNDFKLDQVQTFMPTPMAMATTMYHTRKNPLHKVSEDSEVVETARAGKIRTLHKAFLRYHDPENWPILRDALQRMGRSDLIGNSDRCLIPRNTPPSVMNATERRRETPAAKPALKKFGASPPRSGAVVRNTAPEKPGRKSGTGPVRTGRK